MHIRLYLVAALICVVSHAEGSAKLPRNANSAPISGKTSIPYGWVDFCQRYRGECDGADLPAMSVTLTWQTIKEIRRINRWVNSRIVPTADIEHWGIVDQWDYPTDGKGDCEDYALMKRKLLIAEGLPRQALLITIVRDIDGEGHAVLMVKTSAGDLVLDSLRDDVRMWMETDYRFVKRQSQTNQNVWVAIGVPTPPPPFVSQENVRQRSGSR